MIYNDINICSRALLKLGAEGITSFEEGSAESEVASNLYPLIRDSLISSYTWSFATAQKLLPRLTDAPQSDYQYAYQLPNDFLRVISAGIGNRGRGIEYRIFENRLHTNANEVNLTYIFRPHEGSFPAFFTEALVSKLAAEFCLPLTESTTRAAALLEKSENDIKRARITDAQQSTPKRLDDFTLIGIRK